MASPFSTQCPNCDARLKIQNPKAVGKKVRCPNCQSPFTVRSPRTRPPEDDFELEDEYYDDYEDYEDYEEDYEPPRRTARRRGDFPSKAIGSRRKKSRKKANAKIGLILGGTALGILLLVGLGFAIYALAGGGQAVDFAWLPPESQVVISVDVDEIWHASVVQRAVNSQDVAELGRSMDTMKEKLKKLGFQEGESFDAIDSVTFGVVDPDRNDLLGVLRKKTAWNVEAFKANAQLEEQTHEGKTYYKMGSDGFYFADHTTLVAGTEQRVKEALTRGPQSNLAEKFSFLPRGQVVVGFLPDDLSDFRRKLADKPMPPGVMDEKEYLRNIMEGLRKVQGGALVLNLGSGIEIEVLAKCDDSAAAGQLASGLEDMLADAHRELNNNRDNLDNPPAAVRDFKGFIEAGEMVFNTMDAGQSGDVATFSFEVSSAAIDKMEQTVNRIKNQDGGRKPPFMPFPGFDFGKMFGQFGGPGGGGFGPFGQAREAAQRAEDKNNLKQIGLAFHNHHDHRGAFPPAEEANSQLSWRVHLLPYLDQHHLYDQFHLDEPWNSPHNIQLVNKMPDVFRRPGSNLAPGRTSYLGIAGPGGMMEQGGGKRFRDTLDGTSNTILVAEVEDHAGVIWTQPVDYNFNVISPLGSLGGWKDGFHALYVDGSVHFISRNINAQALLDLLQRNNGR